MTSGIRSARFDGSRHSHGNKNRAWYLATLEMKLVGFVYVIEKEGSVTKKSVTATARHRLVPDLHMRLGLELQEEEA